MWNSHAGTWKHRAWLSSLYRQYTTDPLSHFETTFLEILVLIWDVWLSLDSFGLGASGIGSLALDQDHGFASYQLYTTCTFWSIAVCGPSTIYYSLTVFSFSSSNACSCGFGFSAWYSVLLHVGKLGLHLEMYCLVLALALGNMVSIML